MGRKIAYSFLKVFGYPFNYKRFLGLGFTSYIR